MVTDAFKNYFTDLASKHADLKPILSYFEPSLLMSQTEELLFEELTYADIPELLKIAQKHSTQPLTISWLYNTT